MAKKVVLLFCVFLLTLPFLEGCKGKSEPPKQATMSAEAEKQTGDESAPPEPEGEAPSPRDSSNASPKITSAKIVPDPAYATTDLTVEVEGEDREGDFITYSYQWIKAKEGGSVEEAEDLEGATAPSLSHENYARGDALAVKITPFDGRSKGQTYRTKFTVIANTPPKITSQPPELVPDKNLYTYQVKAEDADSDPVTFSLNEGAPQGMTIEASTGLITWPISEKSVGAHDVTVNADDGHQGVASQHYTLTLKYEQVAPEQK